MKMRVVLAASVALAVAACQDQAGLGTRHLSPIPPATMSLMAAKGMTQSDPILVRAYKKESELELWKKGSDGRYALLKTYPICRWSGQLGPKIKEGDRQAPEGFYTVTPAQMNPNSSYYLSFDTGFPNAFDRAHGRTGSHLMVHGTCSSRGCFAMTDEAIAEVYALAREAFAGGQRGFQFQSYPFRMTAENLAKHRADPHMPFWRNLKEGSDYFEVMREEPPVSVVNRRYHFGPEHPAVAQKRAQDEARIAELVGSGIPAVRTIYDDGGGHSSFHRAMVATAGGGDDRPSAFAFLDARASRRLGEVSRPEALVAGPREVVIETPGNAKERGKKTPIAKAPAWQPAGVTSPENKPLYQRAPSLFGKSDGQPAAAPASEPASAAPVAPRRGASVAPTTKPQTKGLSPDHRAALDSPVMTGAQPILRGTDGFSRVN